MDEISEALEGYLKDKEAELAKKRRTISITNTREPNYSQDVGNVFPENFDYRGYLSIIKFSRPVSDFNGLENKQLGLRTLWFSEGQTGGYCWGQVLDDEKGHLITSYSGFGHLEGHFHDYVERRLETWQKEALIAHKKVLEKIERGYFNSKGLEITENFLR